MLYMSSQFDTALRTVVNPRAVPRLTLMRFSFTISLWQRTSLRLLQRPVKFNILQVVMKQMSMKRISKIGISVLLIFTLSMISAEILSECAYCSSVETVSGDTVSADSISSDSDSVSGDAVSEDSISEDTVSAGGESGDAISTDRISENTIPADTTLRDEPTYLSSVSIQEAPAKASSVTTYSVLFNGNGNTSGSMREMTDLRSDREYALYANSFRRKGYRFSGWNTRKDGTGKALPDRANIKALTAGNDGSVILYAQWKKIRYTISYKLQGGSNNSVNPKSYTITSSDVRLKAPSKKGYRFGGWYSDKAYRKRVTRIKKGSTGNRILYAKWIKKTKESYDDGYGVYIGLDDFEKLKKLSEKDSVIVIEGQSFTAGQIKKLKSGGRRVYSYIDVGSLETYRPYYNKFKDLALDSYENWPDEYWIDVSDKSWQNYIAGKVAGDLVKKGVDGLFVDNCDVYYVYDESDAIYKGLLNIVKKLDGYGVDVIINGGDTFVTRLIKDKKAGIIDGVNQESVFSRITDYENDVFKSQTAEENKYFRSYLSKAKKSGLDVYLLEYTRDESIKKKIKSYCSANGFRYFISDKISLDGS